MRARGEVIAVDHELIRIARATPPLAAMAPRGAQDLFFRLFALRASRHPRPDDLLTPTGRLRRWAGELGAASALVLVHLNPRAPRPDTAEERRGAGVPLPSTFEEYFDFHRHFGAGQYGPSSPRTHRSAFDHKQLQFLRPFGVIDFVEERPGGKGRREDRLTNLERVMDRKLQLELIPYGSPSFSARGLTRDVLKPHLDRVLQTLVAAERRYVLFCGSVFAPLLREYIVETHRFRLERKDGGTEHQVSRFATLQFRSERGVVRAGLAFSWARQGIPMTAYAEQILARYDAT